MSTTPSLDRRILHLLGQEGRPLGIRDIHRELDLTGDERRELKETLRRLLEEGTLQKMRGSRVGLAERMNLLVGRLTCTAGGYGFVAPESAGRDRDDVFVAAANLREALHGDRVVVRVERRTSKGLEGRIIRVLERALKEIVGRYEEDGHFGGHVVPFDRRILHEIQVPQGDDGGAVGGQMVVVLITRPPTATRNPGGRVTSVLGRLEDRGVDLRVVAAKFNLPESFPPEVLAEAERMPTVVDPTETVGRKDFRAWPTVTIDPDDARDHDDAVSCDALVDGTYRLGIHIADVAHYVHEGTAIDQEAYLRGTSVYFPGHVVPMLPHELSSGICSLVEGEDRLAQTVVLHIDVEGRILATEFHDSVIRSAARLTYREAQAILDGDPDTLTRRADLVDLVVRLDTLARRLRRQRDARGALDLDSPEPKVVLDESGEMTGIVTNPRLDSMRLVEEFMLAANEAVAGALHGAGVGSLYRVHEPPDPERVDQFRELVKSFGYPVAAPLSAARPEDFQQILREIAGKPEERLLSTLLLRTLKLARYHEESLGHFGLATDLYAHFTSPIRRYPDLVVHRALRALRSGRGPALTARIAEALPEMGRHLSDTERRAAEAERELLEWKKVRFMASHIGEVHAGYVTGVQAFGLFVELDELFVQGLVHVSSMTDDYYRFNEKAHLLKGENSRRTYRLGDRVVVKVARVDMDRRQAEFVLEGVAERTLKVSSGRRVSRRTRK